jgi:hypothetical protein
MVLLEFLDNVAHEEDQRGTTADMEDRTAVGWVGRFDTDYR